MTRRQIRKLRKRIAKFEPYLVWRSWGSFGDFDGCDCVKIMAESHSHAVERYVKRKERQMKEMSDLRQCWFNETTRMFARVKVANKKGEKNIIYKYEPYGRFGMEEGILLQDGHAKRGQLPDI